MAVLVVAGAAMFFGTMGSRDLWEPEELRYAQVTQEMNAVSDWFVLHLNGVRYPEKPPLFYWSIALFGKLSGRLSEFAVRLPSVLSGLGVLVFVFLLGRRLYGNRGGFFAAIFLLTMPFFLQMSIEARMDMMLTLFITASLFCLYVAHEDGYGTWLYAVAYGLMGLAVLTKGPVGAMLPLLSFAAFVFLKENVRVGAGHAPRRLPLRYRKGLFAARVRAVLAIRLSPFPLRLGWGVLIIALVILPWLVPACIIGGWKHTYELLFHQNVTRYLNSWTHEEEPIYLYLGYVPLQLLPWVFLLPSMMIFGLKREPVGERWSRRFPLIWFLTVLLFFTFCSSKRWIYTLPLIPAAALMMGGVLRGHLEGILTARESLVLKAAWAATAGAMLLVGITALPVAALFLRDWFLVCLGPAVIAIAGMTGALLLLRRGLMKYGVYATLLTVLVAWPVWCWTFFPQRNRSCSAKVMFKKIGHLIPPGEVLHTYGTERNGYSFYWTRQPPIQHLTRFVLLEADPVQRAKRAEQSRERFRELCLGPKPMYCLMADKTYERLKGKVDVKLYVLVSGLMGTRNISLVSNQPLKATRPE